MTLYEAEWRAEIVRIAERFGFTEADVQRVYEKLGRYPTMPEIEAASHRLVAKILMDGHLD
jgi:hypothetical protein